MNSLWVCTHVLPKLSIQCGCCLEGFGGCFVNVVISNRNEIQSCPDTGMIPHEQYGDMSRLLCLQPFLRLSARPLCASVIHLQGGILSQHKTLGGSHGFENVSQASIGVAQSGWTVPLNKSPGHKRRHSLMMFDVSAHWISLYLETQSQEEMNPLKMSPGGVLPLFFLFISPFFTICQNHALTPLHSPWSI